MAALAPIPSESVTTKVEARPLARRSDRRPIRMSCPIAATESIQRLYQTRRIESRMAGTYPNSRSAARRAASGSSPRSIRSFTLRAMWPRISSSSSRSWGRMALLVLRRVHDPPDRVHQLRPAILFAQQLGFSRGGQPVVLGALIGFADVPLGIQPATLLEAVQRRIERTGL